MSTNPSTALAIIHVQNYAVMQSSPEELREIMEANVGMGGVSDFDLDRLRVPAGGATTWEVPGLSGAEPAKSVEGIIVAWRDPRAYWSKGLDTSGGGTPPDCSSADGRVGIGMPGGDCAVCPFAQFGSAEPRGDGKPALGQACKSTRLLFLVREGGLLPLVVVAPPSSLKPVKRYFLRLVSSATPIYGVVTALSLEKARSKGGIEYAAIAPRLVGKLDPETTERMKSYGESVARIFARVGVTPDDVHGANDSE